MHRNHIDSSGKLLTHDENSFKIKMCHSRFDTVDLLKERVAFFQQLENSKTFLLTLICDTSSLVHIIVLNKNDLEYFVFTFLNVINESIHSSIDSSKRFTFNDKRVF